MCCSVFYLEELGEGVPGTLGFQINRSCPHNIAK